MCIPERNCYLIQMSLPVKRKDTADSGRTPNAFEGHTGLRYTSIHPSGSNGIMAPIHAVLMAS